MKTATTKFRKVKAAAGNGQAIWEAEIGGQTWHFQGVRYWSPNTGGGCTSSSCKCWRVAGGAPQKLEASSRKRAVAVIAERIESGTY